MARSTLILKSPVLATAAAAGFLVAAAASGTVPTGNALEKSDRFAIVGEQLCGNQAWPNITAECVAWKNNAPTAGETVRYLTMQKTDAANGITELQRVAVPQQ